MSYVLLGADGKPYTSEVKGRWGGHRRMRIYGRLDCSSARAAIARGGYARYRVFFADEATAIAAGYRPCASCCADRYRVWKMAQAAQGIAAACQDGIVPTPDPYDLERFVTAQDAGGSYQRAVAELRTGRKTSHWMWYVFPQIAGLGQSPTSKLYSISSVDEASAYLAHPLLGPRLRECAEILTALPGRTAEHIFGGIDAMKLRSAMTLFARAASGEPVFGQVLDQYFGGVSDAATDRLIRQAAGGTRPDRD
jgi:uncharacterized protein (DUF1810 family)